MLGLELASLDLYTVQELLCCHSVTSAGTSLLKVMEVVGRDRVKPLYSSCEDIPYLQGAL